MNNSSPVYENTCIIIVTFHPDEKFKKSIYKLFDLVSQVIIVDNGSSNSFIEFLHFLLSDKFPVKLILNNNNYGIAIALNQGLNVAIENGYSWSLLLDQDSEPNNDIIKILSECYNYFPDKSHLAIIGSCYTSDINQIDLFCNLNKDSLWMEAENVITSGTVINLCLYKVIGTFRESFFIDNVDIEYCLRARKRGFKIIKTTIPVMVHKVGTPTIHKLFWREIEVSNHSSVRRYYMMRNDIFLIREYFFTYPMKMLKIIYWRIMNIFLIIFFESNRKSKLKYSLLGLIDGLILNFHRHLS